MIWVDPPEGWALDGVAVRATRIEGPPPPVDPSEAEAVRGSVPVRVREFAFGRAAARSALAAAGGPAIPLLRRPDRTPAFPPGWAGSLSHTRELAVGVASARWRALGVDVEAIRPLDPGMVEIIATPSERSVDPLALFSAKEAVFKAWFTAGGTRILDFHEVVLELRGDRFAVIDHPEPRVAIEGRLARALGHWWSLAGVR